MIVKVSIASHVYFSIRWTVFGFFWLEPAERGMLSKMMSAIMPSFGSKEERLLQLYVACTIGMTRS